MRYVILGASSFVLSFLATMLYMERFMRRAMRKIGWSTTTKGRRSS